jgi:hypothetical protein
MADTAGEDVDDDLARTRIGDEHIHHFNGFALLPGYHTAHCLTHAYNLKPADV